MFVKDGRHLDDDAVENQVNTLNPSSVMGKS